MDTQEELDWWRNNAIEWKDMCKKAWKERDFLQAKVQRLEQELLEERGHL